MASLHSALVGEGGAHWILRPPSPSPPAAVVRVAKRAAERRRAHVEHVHRHVQALAGPLGAAYVDAGTVVPAPPLPLPPPPRVGQLSSEYHQHQDQPQPQVDHDPGWGLRVRDWMCWADPAPGVASPLPQDHRAVLTVELKPKCGLACAGRSKLVPPMHRVKFRNSRFVMTQARKIAEGKVRERSGFDPCLLFSGSSVGVALALEALLAHPQNNLRVFLDGRAVPPDDPGALAAALATAFPNACGGGDGAAQHRHSDPAGAVAWFVGTLACVLAEEPLLARVLAMQRRDVVDVEGANLLLDKITSCLGSTQAAEQALNEALEGELPPPPGALVAQLAWLEQPGSGSKLGNEPGSEPAIEPRSEPGSEPGSGSEAGSGSEPNSGEPSSGEPAGTEPPGQWASGRAAEAGGGAASPSAKEWTAAMACVDGLACADTINLVANWLLALAAGDCSVMLAMVELDTGLTVPARALQGAGQAYGVLPRRPDCAWGGVEYQLGLADVGPKPVAKVRSKAAEEPAFCARADTQLASASGPA